ncbi:hypothetical protein LO763_19395 [Glycomyces sp. A-F 0318]|uniref:hypothetical protein n=1 Tax=Glycomyces amatae TaxID=2881355 RepID=UPI001E31A5ED|nr:hypothetical protein [Glycomyces amatae]MCD0445777.1 hypothetical protein [Glycomyces amatae]
MRALVPGAAAVLLLAGCGGPEEPEEGPSPSATASASQRALDYAAVCDGFSTAVALPNGDAVEYVLDYNEPTGWATNASVCDVEPAGDYFDAAAAAGVFGRAELNVGVLAEEQLQQAGYPEYDPDAAEDLLALDQAEPGNIEREGPCDDEPCDDSLFSYMYRFRFETVTGDVAVIAQFDYITTDTGGDQQSDYRELAVEAFTASMDAVTAELR